MGCVAVQTAHGPAGLPLPIGAWYLHFQIRFLEMPGQHPTFHGFACMGLLNRTQYFCWQCVKQVFVKLIMLILVMFCVYLQPFCETVPGL